MNTNVTITDEQMAKIKAISETTGVTSEDLVRQAVDRLIEEKAPRTGNWREALEGIYGIWKDRDDLDEVFQEFRDEFENRQSKLFVEDK